MVEIFTVTAFITMSVFILLVLLVCNIFYISQYKKMKDTALQASRISPSPVSWRAVGMACYYVSKL